MKLLVLHFLLFFATGLAFLDEESVKEKRCRPIKTVFGSGLVQPDPNIDFNWIGSVQKWYYGIMSKLELYRAAADVLGQPTSEISPSQLAFPCLTCNAKYECTGFNRTTPANLWTHEIKKTGVDLFRAKNKYAKPGTNTIGLTNNKNFVVSILCWMDTEASYEVWSTTPTLPEEDKKIALDYLKKLGFSMDYLVETGFEGCPDIGY